MEQTPYDVLIGDGNPADIQSKYEQHRTKRNADQRQKLLSRELSRLDIDPTLYKLQNKEKYPNFIDERHCLVFWARPPPSVRELISGVQERLSKVAPNLWLMPASSLHMTAMEITHSLTAAEIAERVSVLTPKLTEITDFTYNHRARLVKPKLGFDASAVALSFVPAAGEGADTIGHNDSYTYHHLRRDLWSLCRSSGVQVASRYVLPSAHLTVARFTTNADHASSADFDDEPGGNGRLDSQKLKIWLDAIEEINEWLRKVYWPNDTGEIAGGGQWIVGEGKGLDCKAGTIWYGRDSSDSIRVGKGFDSGIETVWTST